MQIYQLEQFCAVAKLEHMSKAAESLHISQPTLSLNISRLEKELGVSLFDRTGRNIKLNRYGKTFLTHVEKALGELELAKEAVIRLDQQENNQIHLGDAIIDNTYKIISAYMDTHNLSQITHQTATIPEILSLLRNGSIDLAIVATAMNSNFGSDIRWLPVVHSKLMALLPENHRLAKQKSIILRDLKDEPLMNAIPNFDFRDNFDQYCERIGFTPNYVYTSIKPFLFNDLTREKGYISLIPDVIWEAREEVGSVYSAVNDYRRYDGIVGVEITNPNCYIDYGILTSKKHVLSAQAEDFKDFVCDFLQTRIGEL